jgi:hypothetical protein
MTRWISLLVALAAAAPSAAAAADTSTSPRIRPLYRATDEFSARDRAPGFRGITLGFAGQLTFAWVYPMDGEGARSFAVAGTPVVDLLAEFGTRRVRFVVGPYTAPVYMGFSDFFTATFIGARAGLLVGGERFRFGATAGGGLLGAEANIHALLTPWRDRHGHRHGIEVSAGMWLFRQPSFTIGYRFAPAALNHVGGRWEALQRARGSEP